jgi:hypothetical protein
MMLHCNNTQPDINRIPQQKNSLNIGFPVAMPSIQRQHNNRDRNKSLRLHSKSTWRPKLLWILCSVSVSISVSVSSVCLSVLSVSLSFAICFAGSPTLQHLGMVDILGLNPNPLNPTSKGKPGGHGSAFASALFHPRCRCTSGNVAQWSLLTINSDENLSRN